MRLGYYINATQSQQFVLTLFLLHFKNPHIQHSGLELDFHQGENVFTALLPLELKSLLNQILVLSLKSGSVQEVRMSHISLKLILKSAEETKGDHTSCMMSDT